MKKPQLIVLHYAGGNCYSFQFLFPYLDNFSILPIELPGRGKRIEEPLKRDFYSAVNDLKIQILKRLDDSDFVVYGHSMGAILALEVTHTLEQLGKHPSFLLVSGSEAPRINSKRRYLLEDSELIEELIKFGGVLPETIKNTDFLNYYLPILRADFEVSEKNSYTGSIVSAPIYALMGDKEERVLQIANWKNFTISNFNYEIFKGGHFFIHEYPRKLANILASNYEKYKS